MVYLKFFCRFIFVGINVSIFLNLAQLMLFSILKTNFHIYIFSKYSNFHLQGKNSLKRIIFVLYLKNISLLFLSGFFEIVKKMIIFKNIVCFKKAKLVLEYARLSQLSKILSFWKSKFFEFFCPNFGNLLLLSIT